MSFTQEPSCLGSALQSQPVLGPGTKEAFSHLFGFMEFITLRRAKRQSHKGRESSSSISLPVGMDIQPSCCQSLCPMPAHFQPPLLP